MPNWRKGYQGPQRKYRSKKSSARTIQRAWKRRARPSGVKRMIISNRKLIKKVAGDIEVKHQQNRLATTPNYVGDYLVDVGIDNLGFDTAAHPAIFGLRPLAGITQGLSGDSSAGRVGEWIQLRTIRLRYLIKAGYEDVPPFQIQSKEVKQKLTIIVIKDMTPEQSLPAWSQIFTTAAPQEFNPNLTFLNLKSVQNRFKVLKKVTRTVHVSQPFFGPSGEVNGIFAQGRNQAEGTITLKIPYKFQYTDSGPFNRPVNQSVYVLACSNQAANALQLKLNVPTLSLCSRTAYKDP